MNHNKKYNSSENATSEEISVDVQIASDFRIRIKTSNPEHVVSITKELTVISEEHDERKERRQMRRFFFYSAHVLVFGIAIASAVGIVLDFFGVIDVETKLFGAMITWIIISIAWYYFAIIKDLFKIKKQPPPPPSI